MKKIIASPTAPKAVGPYSQAVLVNGFLFASGQLPVNPAAGKLVEGDIKNQFHQVMKNLSAVLKEADLSFDDVVKTTIFLTDMANFSAVNEVYAEYFPGDKPARSCVQVAALPLGGQVEMELIACQK
ncbi:MAG TPA: reactive intermediate/imine deaminase [Aminobacterium sp.]|jgi:2-iminobutanoate/2-iminopropanoate deaminase|uniref:RidA family protein n=1 Tax=Aminobacterium TaxID=81466 RepID=UPI000ECD6998|nr:MULTISPECIES: RidA family protein [unclassified Aminobacterium]HCA41086.1 reactive intermediate/imine deaminase [Aminobacterium sp.]